MRAQRPITARDARSRGASPSSRVGPPAGSERQGISDLERSWLLGLMGPPAAASAPPEAEPAPEPRAAAPSRPSPRADAAVQPSVQAMTTPMSVETSAAYRLVIACCSAVKDTPTKESQG